MRYPTIGIIFFLCALMNYSQVWAQEARLPRAAYGEFWGNGGMFSLNFDKTVFKKGFLSGSYHIGAGIIGGSQNPKASTTFLIISGFNLLPSIKGHIIEIGIDPTLQINEGKRGYIIAGNLGYRLMVSSGLFARLDYTPIFKQSDKNFWKERIYFVRPIFGISIGKLF
jgi:hypothetical protein